MNGNSMGYFLGRGLAIVVVIPLAYYLITIIFYKPNKVTEAIINKYMTDTIITKDNIGKDPPLSADSLGLQRKKIAIYVDQNNTGDHYYDSYIFYSKTCNKYFNLISIIEMSGIYDGLPEYMNIIMTTNKEDLNNSAYGTIDNPVPVFKFVGVEKSIRANNKDYDQAYMDKIFHDNVEIYLKYVMPKKEFKARYGK
jgi:hypothetical protein